MIEVRCGNCGYWLGEASEELVLLGHVKHGEDAKVEPPRDLRHCVGCKRVNVFVPLASLDGSRSAPVQ